jgi:hypothetical protein
MGKRRKLMKEINPDVARTASELCREGGEIEAVIRQKSDGDLVFAAAVADRVFVHIRDVARNLAREAAEQAQRESGTSKRQTYIQLADLLGRSRSTVAERLKLY